MILQGIGLSILLASSGTFMIWIAIVVIGLGMGGVGTLTPLVIFDMFGLRQFGSISGLLSPVSQESRTEYNNRIARQLTVRLPIVGCALIHPMSMKLMFMSMITALYKLR